MMRPRLEKITADLFGNKARSLLVIASVAVGLFAVGMMTIVYNILSNDMRAGYRAVRPANIKIQAVAFDQDFVEHIARLPGVADAQGARNIHVQIRTASGEWKPISIKAIAVKDLNEQPISRVDLLQGSWPPEEKQLVLDVNKLSETGVRLADVVELKLPSGTIRRMPLAGIVRDQTIGAGGVEGSFFLAPIQGYVSMETLPSLEEPEIFNTLFATVREDREDRAAIHIVTKKVIDEFDRYGYITISSVARGSSEHPNISYVEALIAVVYILGFLVMFLSGFLITNILSALLNQQVTQIGVMKSLGATRMQIILVYMVLILAFSLIALAVSIPLSQRAAWAMLHFLAGQINFSLQGVRPVPEATFLQILMALIIPQIAGSFPIVQGTRISVREALSGSTGSMTENTGFAYRLLLKLRGLSRPLMISLRNTFRRRARLVLTLITLGLGGSIFMATLNVRNSLDAYIDRMGRYFLADVNITFSQPYRADRVTRDLLQVPGVQSVEGWAGVIAQVVEEDGSPGESVQLVAPPAGSRLVEPILLKGRWIQPGDEGKIVLCELFLKNMPELGIGDNIRLRIGTDEKDWEIAGFFQFAGRASGFVAYTGYDYLARETGIFGRAVYYRIVGTGGSLTLEQQEALGFQVSQYLAGRGYDVNEISAGLDLREKLSKGLNVLTLVLLILSFLLAAVGSIGLMGMMSLNVMERTREIGVMRAIGGSDRSIMNIVLAEGLLIGFISWVFASLVALPISKLLADQIFQIIYDRPAEMAFTGEGNLIWLGIVLLLSVLASAIPAYNASRLTIREVLAYE